MASPVEPVTVAEAKARLGVRSNHRDAELARLIRAARRQVEDYSGHVLVRRPIKKYFKAFAQPGRGLELNLSPIVSLDEVAYLDSAGVETVLAPAGRVIDGEWPRVFPAVGSAWPVPGDPAGIRVTVTAGYDPAADPGSDEAVPEQLIQALLLLVGHWFENHEASVVGTSAVELPEGVKDLCSQFRAPGLT